MPLPAPGTTPGDRMLDTPPPSPAFERGMSPGPSPDPSGNLPGALGGMVPPIPSGGMPPEVLTGMLQAGEQMASMIDSFAQVTPDLATDWAAVKTTLLAAMAKVLQAGAAPTSPNATGMNFPGGGIDRGGMPAASGF
jgi:hypothetical protein